MLSREILVLCPSCGCHARAYEAACPHCGAALRRSEGLSALGLALLGAVALGVASLPQAGCGGEARREGGGGGGGAGGAGGGDVSSGPGVTTTTTIATTTIATTVTSYGPAPTCDDPFDDAPPCALCLESFCCYELEACASGDCGALATCTGDECASACPAP